MNDHHTGLSRRRFATVTIASALSAQFHSAVAQHSPFAPDPTSNEDEPTPVLDLVRLEASNPPGGQGRLWEYANVDAQFAAVGVDPYIASPDPADQTWMDATFALSGGLATRSATLQATFMESLGFDPWGMSQSMMAGDSFGHITLFRGKIRSQSTHRDMGSCRLRCHPHNHRARRMDHRSHG